MQFPHSRSIICPIMIGRLHDLKILNMMMAQVRQGVGQVVLVDGEAGVGKTRLIAELKTQAQQQNLQILQGNCFETDAMFPFAPIIDLFHGYISTSPGDAVKRQLSDPALHKILPELDWLTTTSLFPTEPEAEKRRLFYAIWQTFVRLASQQPLLIVVEDVHWGDEISLDCLLYVARHLATQPILLVLSYRTDEVTPGLQHMFVELDRARLATEIQLKLLNASEVEAMLRAIFDLRRTVDTEFLQTLVSLTEGNPFFIEEVLKSLSQSGGSLFADLMVSPLKDMPIPRTIREIVQRRSQHLSAAARETLIAAAVVGTRFTFSLLQSILDFSQPDLLEAIKELVAAQLLIEDRQAAFAFRHALIQHAVYTDLLSLERIVWHQKVAEVVEYHYKAAIKQHWGELANQFYYAEQWSKTFEYGQRAGHQAIALYAPRSALNHFTRALEAAYKLDSPVPPSLYRACAQAHQTLGEFAEAKADFDSAIRIAESNHDVPENWQALLDLGVLWTGRDYKQTLTCYQRALDLARATQDIPMIATSLNRLGNWHMNVEQPIEALDYHRQALTTVEQLNFDLGLAETLMFIGFATAFTSDMLQSAAAFERAAELFRKYDIRIGLIYALGGLTLCSPSHISDTLAAPPISLNAAVQNNETALRIAREINWRGGEAFILSWLAACASTQGDYGKALDYAQVAVLICEQIGNREYACSIQIELGFLYSDLFALDQAQQHFELAVSLAREINSLHFVCLTSGLLAEVYIRQGNLDRAEATINAVLNAGTAQLTFGQRRCWYGWALLALAKGDAQMTLDLLDGLIESAANLASGEIIPLLASTRGKALVQLARFVEAEAVFQAAHTQAKRQGARSLQRQTAVCLGQLYRLQGRRTEANEAFARARVITADLAATIPDESLRAAFLRGAEKELPTPPSLSPRQMTKQSYGGLTEREREVAALTVRGLTNRQIADELSISEETATVHIKHILSKLIFTSRSQIAAWAVDNNLSAPTSDDSTGAG